MTWRDGRLEIRRYWTLSYTPDASYSSEEEMKERIRAELLEATRLRLRRVTFLGCLLVRRS